MSILWIDGFEEYSSGNGLINAAYQNVINAVYGNAGRFSGNSLTFTNSSGTVIKGIPATDTVSVGVAVKAGNNGSSKVLFRFQNALGDIVSSVFVTALGAVTYNRGQFVASELVVMSDPGKFKFDQWCYVEIELTRHASAGVVKIYVNGELVATATSSNTGAYQISAVGVRSIVDTNSYIDDLYITDTATRVGECRVDTLVPSADTAQKDFTASTGTDNYAMVDELPVDGDTTYVEGDTIGNADLYDVTDLPDAPDDIRAVQVRAFARKTDTGLRTLKTTLKSGSTTADGTPRALGTAYQSVSSLYELDPDTDAAWTYSAINAAQIGMEIAT